MREQMAQRRARRAGRIFKRDDPFLDRDEHRDSRCDLRHGCPAKRPLDAPIRDGCAVRVHDGGGGVVARPAVDLPKSLHAPRHYLRHGSPAHLSSGAAFEERVGYSRAVRVGDTVCGLRGPRRSSADDADPPEKTPTSRRGSRLEIIGRALGEAGATLDDVVRTRGSTSRGQGDIDAVGRAHREAFCGRASRNDGDRGGAFLDARWLVEIEAEAVVGSARKGPGE